MNEWLSARERLVTRLRGKYGEGVVKAITGLIDKFITYNEELLNYWRSVRITIISIHRVVMRVIHHRVSH